MTEKQTNIIRTLLIEDNRTDAVVVKWLFERHGSGTHVLHHVTTLRAGLDYISKHDVDIVLLDQVLPDSSAAKTFSTLHGQHPDLPIIVLSSIQDPATLTSRMLEGAADYIVKGDIGHDILFHTIDRSIRKKQHDRQAEKAKADAKKREYLQSLGLLAGGVAHDLNNALGPLMSLPEIIGEDIDEFRETGNADLMVSIKEDLEFMVASAERAAGIVKDLMGMSRRGRYDEQPVDLNKMITQYLHSQDFAFLVRGAPGMSIKKRLSTHPPVVLADAQQLTRVLSNLILNGVEALGESGTIVVETTHELIQTTHEGYALVEPGTYAVLRIHDNGCGIAKDVQTKMFEPFYSTKPKGGRTGTGLGLAVVLGIIRDHGGAIDIESSPDKGSVFSVYLPLVEQKEADAAPAAGNRHHVEDGRSILVVDDERVARHAVCRILRKSGYTVAEAKNGHEAVSIFREPETDRTPFSLVLLDMIMEPDFDGLATMKAILEISPSQDVVIVSGYSHETKGREAIELGAGWLTKPFTKSALLEAISARPKK